MRSFVCPRCGAESWHPEDVKNGYCGRCRWPTGDPVLGSPDVLAQAEHDGAIEPLPEPPPVPAGIVDRLRGWWRGLRRGLFPQAEDGSW